MTQFRVDEEEMERRVVDEWNVRREKVVSFMTMPPELITRSVSLRIDPASAVKERWESVRMSEVELVMKGPEMTVTDKEEIVGEQVPDRVMPSPSLSIRVCEEEEEEPVREREDVSEQ